MNGMIKNARKKNPDLHAPGQAWMAGQQMHRPAQHVGHRVGTSEEQVRDDLHQT